MAIHYAYKPIWNAFVGEVLLCKQDIQIQSTAFIQGWHLLIIIVTCIVATNKGRLLLKV